MKGIFRDKNFSANHVRELAMEGSTTVSLNYQQCCKLLAEAIQSGSHFSGKELKAIADGIKKTFCVDKIDLSSYMPKRQQSLNVVQNAGMRWKEQQRELKEMLADVSWS